MLIQQSAVRAGQWVTALFATTAFIGAALLFAVQPLVARLLLPSYGGSATVWSTASLFFQLLLLAAYVWAHWSGERLGRRWQPRAQLLLLLAPIVFLPIALPADSQPGAEADPALWLLRTLVLMIGLPFAVVACTGPVIQTWYTWVGARGEDPYFLFAASNLGSFVGLLAYPFVIEPTMSLATQRLAWSWGFVGYGALMVACAVLAIRGRDAVRIETLVRTPRPDARQILLWGLLAFLPSSLMLAVTAHLSTDVSPIPLLWVVPLAVYLATFVAAFARSSRRVPTREARIAGGFALLAMVVTENHDRLWLAVLVNIALLWFGGYAAHGRLAASRPAAEHLTLFYLVVAVGGAAGGILNGLLAPVVFDRVVEYPLVIVAIPLLLLGAFGLRSGWAHRRYPPVPATMIVFGSIMLAGVAAHGAVTLGGSALVVAPVAVAVVATGWFCARHAASLALVLAAMAVWMGYDTGGTQHTRSFFGAYEIQKSDGAHILVHGTTVHGLQFRDPEQASVPTSYYGGAGSCADVIELLRGRLNEVGVVGLGAGTIAAHGRVGERYTFYEIDPGIVELATDPEVFSFLSDSAAEIRTEVGDGRLEVAEEPPGRFDLLVLDAFSSDSIPVHLLTQEAFESYHRSLQDDGVLLVHISNRHFDLRPVVAAGAAAQGWHSTVGSSSGRAPGTSSSTWVALTADVETSRRLRALTRWQPLEQTRPVSWTDDYASVLTVLK